ncbi:MAG: 3-phosphoshikimate 1-carboxyvinyltransferase, partial [Nitrospiraceae bacterium]|nr:3-phosphoshikimate 1-carboxyvinyltransferase [Nitrospiraceae bacterium]
MDRVEIRPARHFKGEFFPPADKSISHRAVILSSLASGRSVVKNFLRAQDTESTMNAFRRLGVGITGEGGTLTINGKGLHGLSEPSDVIDCGNSGTTIRLISGVLSGNPFFSVLTGDDSLRSRPMARVIGPLGMMGAQISARSDN